MTASRKKEEMRTTRSRAKRQQQPVMEAEKPSQKERRRSSLFGPIAPALSTNPRRSKGGSDTQPAIEMMEEPSQKERRRSSLFGPRGSLSISPSNSKLSKKGGAPSTTAGTRVSTGEGREEVIKKRKKSVGTYLKASRITFSFERESDIRPILKRRSRPSHAMTRRQLRRVRIDEINRHILSITPLLDKPRGVVRMPSDSFSSDENEESEGSAAPSRISDYADSVINGSKNEGKYVDQSNLEPTKLNLDASIGSFRVRRTSTSLKWSLTETEITARAAAIRKDKARRKTELWSEMATPQTQDDFFANARSVEALIRWFDEWEKRAGQLERTPPASTPGINVSSRGRGRNKGSGDAQQSPAEVPDEVAEESVPLPPNPLIVYGPSGSGKTCAVNYAVKAKSVPVIRPSSVGQLDVESLKKSLKSAADVLKKNKGGPARANKYNLRSATRALAVPRFAVVVIEDCDGVSSSEEEFWFTLKEACEEMQVPVILTCSDYLRVKAIILAEPPLMSYRSLTFMHPSVGRFSSYLRAWLYGFTGELVGTKWLTQVIREHKCKVPAVLNALQLLLIKSNSGNYAVTRPIAGGDPCPLDEHAKLVSVVAKLDSAFGRTSSCISWRVNQVPDLEQVIPSNYSPLAPYSARDDHYGIFGQVCEQVDEFFKNPQFSSLPYLRAPSDQDRTMKRAVRDASFRSLPGRIYSMREVTLDYLPALTVIDQSFQRSQVERWRQGGGPGIYAAEHPFDEMKPSGAVIDSSLRLKHSISDYTFCERYQPSYF